MDTRLYLYYVEMKEAMQEANEQKVIAQAEHTFKCYEKNIEGMNCEVMLAFKEGRYVLDFVTRLDHVHSDLDRK